MYRLFWITFFVLFDFQMTDTLKIPRATIQYTSQDHLRYYNINRMNKLLVKSKTVDSLPSGENNFETFSNDLGHNEPNERPIRHVSFDFKIFFSSLIDVRRYSEQSTFSSKNLTAANLARLNELHTNTPPTKTDIPTTVANREITITVDSMVTTTNVKPKENDSESNASSTHFTMVNGFGGSRIRPPTKPVCCCNDITSVIVSMTILFVIIIFGVIIFAECKHFYSFSPLYSWFQWLKWKYFWILFTDPRMMAEIE